jgi:hypothetical protein
MKAEDLTLYFSRKIAKAIPRDINFTSDNGVMDRQYAIEPIAVRDGMLHVLVTMRKEEGAFRHERNRSCGSAEIPIREGDTVDLLLDMAIVASDFGEDDIEPFPNTAGDERLANAYREIQARLDRPEGPRPPGC